MKRQRQKQNNSSSTIRKPTPGDFNFNLNWLTVPAGLLMMMVVYYLVGRQGQQVVNHNSLATVDLGDMNVGNIEGISSVPYPSEYKAICTHSLLRFSNRVIHRKTSDTLYPVSCWNTTDGNFRVGSNFTTDEEKEDFAHADSTRSWNDQDVTHKLRETRDELGAKYMQDYMGFQSLLRADNPPQSLAYRFQLNPLSQLLQMAYTFYHTQENVQCGTVAELTIARILMHDFPSLEKTPNFLRVHAQFPHDKPVVPDFITYNEHSTMVLLKPGTSLTENISRVLAKNPVKMGEYFIERFDYGSLYSIRSPGFSDAKNEIIDQVVASEDGMECDAWTGFVGTFPGHCVTQALALNKDLITQIQFLNLNDNPLVPRLLNFFITTYPEVYQWLLEPGIETKEVMLPTMKYRS